MKHRQGFTLIELLVVIAIIALLAAILFPVFAQAREKARAATCVSNEKQLALAILSYAQDFDETYVPAWYSASGGVYHQWPDMVQSYLGQNAKNAKQGTENPGILMCPDDQVLRYNQSTGLPQVGITYAMPMGFYYTPATSDNEFSHSNVSIGSTTIAAGRLLNEIQDPAGTIMIAEYVNAADFIGQTYDSTVMGAFWNPSYAYDPFQSCATAPKSGITSCDNAPLHTGGWNYAFADGHVKWLRPEQTLGTTTPANKLPPKGMWSIAAGD